MQYGFHMSTRGPTEAPQAIMDIAQSCDRLGFDYFGVNDHVVVTTKVDSTYPYTPDGSWAGATLGTCLETVTTMSFIAACTTRIRLLSSVLVLPHRPPVLAAKMLATLDVLSQGRLTIGAGVGWMREEMAALAAPDYARRGSACAEYIEAFRSLWRDPIASYHGEFVDFDNVLFAPKPQQSGGPPIWIGGEGPAAQRRAALHGDGWYPVGRNPRHPLDSLERFSAGLQSVRDQTEAAGRDPNALDIAMFAPWFRLGKPIVENGRRLPFTGPADAIFEDAAAFEEAGLQVLILNLESTKAASETIERCEAFAAAAGLQAS